MTVTDLDSDIRDPPRNSLSKVVSTYWPVNKRFCLPAVGLTSNICRVSSISCLLLPPATQTKPPRRLRLLPPHMVGCASATLLYPPTLASPTLYSPTRPVILRRRQPQHTPAPEPVNPRTPLCMRLDRRIFNGSCSFRLRPRRRPLPCGHGSLAVRGVPPSCVVNVVSNQEEQGDDYTWRG